MILFDAYRANHPAIQRLASYDHKAFRVALIRQLGGLAVDDTVPVYRKPKPPKRRSIAAKAMPLAPGLHLPRFTADKRRNCFRCYEEEKVERKVSTKCTTCDRYFHTDARNCFELYHLQHT
eukprot:scpid88040/ scgid6294/ 